MCEMLRLANGSNIRFWTSTKVKERPNLKAIAGEYRSTYQKRCTENAIKWIFS